MDGIVHLAGVHRGGKTNIVIIFLLVYPASFLLGGEKDPGDLERWD